MEQPGIKEKLRWVWSLPRPIPHSLQGHLQSDGRLLRALCSQTLYTSLSTFPGQCVPVLHPPGCDIFVPVPSWCLSHCSVWLMPQHACHCAPLERAWVHLLSPPSWRQQSDLPEFLPGWTDQVHPSHHCAETVSIQKRVCFYSWLELYRFACPCFHVRVGSFSGLACKTVLCFPKLEALCAGRKPAGDASSSAGKTVPVSLQVVPGLCVNE